MLGASTSPQISINRHRNSEFNAQVALPNTRCSSLTQILDKSPSEYAFNSCTMITEIKFLPDLLQLTESRSKAATTTTISNQFPNGY